MERVALPDSFMLLDYMTSRMTRILKGLDVRTERMRRNLNPVQPTQGLVFSQRIMLHLVERGGMSREDAYAVVQRNALRCYDDGRSLREHLLGDAEFTARMSAAELDGLMDYGAFLQHIGEAYRRCGLE